MEQFIAWKLFTVYESSGFIEKYDPFYKIYPPRLVAVHSIDSQGVVYEDLVDGTFRLCSVRELRSHRRFISPQEVIDSFIKEVNGTKCKIMEELK